MNEYELRDREGVVAQGTLEQIRAKVHELGHHDRQDKREGQREHAQREGAIRARVDQLLAADAEVDGLIVAGLDNTANLVRLATAFDRVTAASERLRKFEPEELAEHEDFVAWADRGPTREEYEARLAELGVGV